MNAMQQDDEQQRPAPEGVSAPSQPSGVPLIQSCGRVTKETLGAGWFPGEDAPIPYDLLF
jgi:hypothetical protein